MPDALISAGAARERVAEKNARLLVVGKGEPHGTWPPGTSFVEVRVFRDSPPRFGAFRATREEVRRVLSDGEGALLGFEAARVYDGGWAEWGSLVAAPVVRGAA